LRRVSNIRTATLTQQRGYSWSNGFTQYPDPRVYFTGQGFYHPLENKPDPSSPFPWNQLKIGPSERMNSLYSSKANGRKQHTISVGTYNPKGRAIRPPEPVFFLHGAGQNSAVWDNVARELNYPYGIINMDLYGHGLSFAVDDTNKRPNKGALVRHALDFLRVLNYFGYDKATIVGQDIGGAVATLCTVMFPDRINAMIHVDSGFSDSQAASVQEAIQKEMSEGFKVEGTSESFNTIHQSNLDHSTTQANDAVNDVLDSLAKDLDFEIEFDLMKKRNPVSVVRPEKNALLSESSFKEIKTFMNCKTATTIKGANSRHELLSNPAYAKQIAATVDDLLSRYDEHRKIELFFEQIKASRDKERDLVEQK
ncbi:hypothetical protein AKO1_003255, partial [Acrasis kona]